MIYAVYFVLVLLYTWLFKMSHGLKLREEFMADAEGPIWGVVLAVFRVVVPLLSGVGTLAIVNQLVRGT